MAEGLLATYIRIIKIFEFCAQNKLALGSNRKRSCSAQNQCKKSFLHKQKIFKKCFVAWIVFVYVLYKMHGNIKKKVKAM